jgi:hypothetical protein
MAMADKYHKFKALPDDILTRLQQLPQYLAQSDVLLAYLFGSLAQAGKGQDVDLALLMPEGERPYHLRQALSDWLATERLDIVDLRRAAPVLRFEIISTGRCLFAYNDTIQLDFERQTLRQYKDTAWLRQKQLQLLHERMNQWSSNMTALPNG